MSARAGGIGSLGLALWVLVVAGCGYAPLTAESLSPDLRSIHVAPVKNETFRPGLEGAVTAALLREFRSDGRVQLASQDASQSDLGGRITAYESLPISFTPFDVGRRYRVRIWLAFALRARGKEQALLEEQVAGEAYYLTGTDVVSTRTAEEEAAQRAIRDLATRVVARILDGL
jgi:hypothetical protein